MSRVPLHSGDRTLARASGDASAELVRILMREPNTEAGELITLASHSAPLAGPKQVASSPSDQDNGCEDLLR